MCGCLLSAPLLGIWPATQACALTRNQTGNPLVCRLELNPLSHTSRGFFLSMKLEVELLDHMVTLYLNFLRSHHIIFHRAAPFYIPISSAQSFHFIIANICYLFTYFLNKTILMGVKWYLIMVYISLMICDFENLFMCSWPFVHLFWRIIC